MQNLDLARKRRLRAFHGNTSSQGIDPTFFAPLTTSLTPARAVGSAAPIYSRATPAVLRDFDGNTKFALASEARFMGARRVHNLIPTGTNQLTTGWSSITGVTNGGSFNGPDGQQYAKLVCNGTNDASWQAPAIVNPTGRPLAGRSFLFSVWVWTDPTELVYTPNDVRLFLYDASVASITSGLFTLTSTPTRMWFIGTLAPGVTDTSLVARIDLWDTFSGPANDRYLYAARAQVEEILGDLPATPNEWVQGGQDFAVGGALGVKYFDSMRVHTQNLWPNSSMSGTVGAAPAGTVQYGAVGGVVLVGAAETVNGISTQIGLLRRGAGAGAQGFLSISASNGNMLLNGKTVTMSAWVRRVAGVTVPANLSITDNGGTVVTLANSAAINAQTAGQWVFYSAQLSSSPTATGTAFYVGAGNAGEGFDIALPQVTLDSARSVLSASSPANYTPTGESAVNTGTDTGVTAPIQTAAILGYTGEVAATNQVRNNMLAGAVAGSPGTLPTGWTDVDTTAVGLVRTVSLGWEDGMPYVDLRYAGTVSTAGNLRINMEKYSAAWPAMLTGDVWTSSVYAKVVSGTLTNLSTPVQGFEYGDAAGVYINGKYNNGALAVSTTRLKDSRVVTGASTIVEASVATFMNHLIQYAAALGAVNITIRIALPQVEKNALATTPVPTSGAAATRNLDSLQYALAGNVSDTVGTLYAEITPVDQRTNANNVIDFGGGAKEVLSSTSFGQQGRTTDGTNTATTTGGTGWNVTITTKKVASAWGGASQAVAITGGTLGTVAAFAGGHGVLGANMRVGLGGAVTTPLNGSIKNLKAFAVQFPNANLSAMVA